MLQQSQPQQENDFSIKAWLLKKVGQYIDGILINGLSALIFGGAIWLLQRFWGLRLIPFNVLDAILLSLAVTVVFIAIIALLIFLVLYRVLKKHPELAFGLVMGLFAGLLVTNFIMWRQSKDEGERSEFLKSVISKNFDKQPDSQSSE